MDKSCHKAVTMGDRAPQLLLCRFFHFEEKMWTIVLNRFYEYAKSASNLSNNADLASIIWLLSMGGASIRKKYFKGVICADVKLRNI